jgi:hypothetical protein
MPKELREALRVNKYIKLILYKFIYYLLTLYIEGGHSAI